MDWIRDNLRDSIDFVVWTGDSARHDNDEDIPRTKKELVESNRIMVEKMLDVFADDTDADTDSNTNTNTSTGGHRQPRKRLRVPIIPSIGNNDIMPHNIFKSGPNWWTKMFDRLWGPFIPEEQRHSFAEGGWFYVEAIPDKLAVFSLNTMYFYESNSAVDGCEFKSDPGYEHMEWLRVQLQLLRDRKMKAILTGHVPPARTNSKQNWYESCWQKYALWLRQYRDVIVGSIYGHMNIDHFILQDFRDLNIGDDELDLDRSDEEETSSEDQISIQGKLDYLSSLKDVWAKLPIPPAGYSQNAREEGLRVSRKKKKRSKKKRFLKKIGGRWGERYALAFVPPSIIPLYFPTLRVVEYNISGLEDAKTWFHRDLEHGKDLAPVEEPIETLGSEDVALDEVTSSKKRKKKKKKGNFKTPKSPSSDATPGPAYSNQPLTWLGYTQYFANITNFNAETEALQSSSSEDLTISTLRDYRRKNENPHSNRGVQRHFEFKVEYDTMSDSIYKLKDMTVNSYLDLARRISGTVSQSVDPHTDGLQGKPTVFDDSQASGPNDSLPADQRGTDTKQTESVDIDSKKENRVWKAFLQRAFVNSRDVDDSAS